MFQYLPPKKNMLCLHRLLLINIHIFPYLCTTTEKSFNSRFQKTKRGEFVIKIIKKQNKMF